MWLCRSEQLHLVLRACLRESEYWSKAGARVMKHMAGTRVAHESHTRLISCETRVDDLYRMPCALCGILGRREEARDLGSVPPTKAYSTTLLLDPSPQGSATSFDACHHGARRCIAPTMTFPRAGAKIKQHERVLKGLVTSRTARCECIGCVCQRMRPRLS